LPADQKKHRIELWVNDSQECYLLELLDQWPGATKAAKAANQIPQVDPPIKTFPVGEPLRLTDGTEGCGKGNPLKCSCAKCKRFRGY
jgi:hypothetical protein